MKNNRFIYDQLRDIYFQICEEEIRKNQHHLSRRKNLPMKEYLPLGNMVQDTQIRGREAPRLEPPIRTGMNPMIWELIKNHLNNLEKIMVIEEC
jgi:hypothetical protein